MHAIFFSNVHCIKTYIHTVLNNQIRSVCENGLRTFRSSAFPGAKSPQMVLSFPWNISSLELSLLWNFRCSRANIPRTFAPWNIRSRGTFAP